MPAPKSHEVSLVGLVGLVAGHRTGHGRGSIRQAKTESKHWQLIGAQPTSGQQSVDS